ncbi:MAG: hypothetical protein U0547_12615 [Dehalococcoidia bacterium]
MGRRDRHPGVPPEVVAASAAALQQSTAAYCFISTLSVYASFAEAGQHERRPLATVPPPGTALSNETYGPLKAACEAEVRAVFGERALIIRPGYIVGPHDPSDRFTYWPVRVREAGEVLAPGSPRGPLQVIDVRDLAAWIIGLLEGGAGALSTPPARGRSAGEFLATADIVAGTAPPHLGR